MTDDSPNGGKNTTPIESSLPTPHPSIITSSRTSNMETIVEDTRDETSVLTSSPTTSSECCEQSGGKFDLAGKKPLADPVHDIKSETSVGLEAYGWKFWKRFGKKPAANAKAGSLSSGSSLISGESSASSKISLPSSTGTSGWSIKKSRPVRILDGSDKDEETRAEGAISTPCGNRCMAIANARAIAITSGYDFSRFSTVRPPRLRPGQRRPLRTPAVPCTRICHTPVHLKRNHWAPKVENSVLEFAVPGACKRTLGVGVEELIVYHGQCIVGAEEPIPSELLGGRTGKVMITVKLKGNAPSQKYHMTIQCDCGTPITRGGLAAKLAAAYMDYLGVRISARLNNIVLNINQLSLFQPRRVLPVRLKSLYTEDGGLTWRAQHAIVMEFKYDYARGLRLPASEMITKIKWS